MSLSNPGLVLRRALLLCVCLTGVACGGANKTPVYPVTGEVFVDGNPAVGALVGFHSLDKTKYRSSSATVEEDGSFRLSTYGVYDGAAAGDYRVTITWHEITAREGEPESYGPDLLGGKYAEPVAESLKATVEPGNNEIFRFDLKMPPKKK